MVAAKVRVGIIGTGGIGYQHAVDIAQLGQAVVVALADPDEQRMHSVASLVGNPTCYTDPNKLIDDSSVDAIVIASPDATHADFILRALALQKPIFCEKPLATSVADALRILEAETRIGRKLIAVGFNRRFDPAHVMVKETIEQGKLGRALLWKGVHRNPSAMYNNEGSFILNNSAGHDVDSARWLLGADVTSVYAWGIRSHDELDESAQDLLCINLEMNNGSRAVGEIYVNARYGYEVAVDVVCQDGVVSTSPRQVVSVRHNRTHGISVLDDFKNYFLDSYAREISQWITSLQTGESFTGADAWDGYCVIVATQAAGKSLALGTSVQVKTIEKPELYKRASHI